MIRLFRFLKPFTLPVLAVLAAVLLQSLADLYLPTLMSDIVDIGVVNGDTGYIVRVGALMLAVAAGGGVCAVVASFLAAKTSSGFGRDIRNKVFTRAESFSLHEFDQIGTASLITRTSNDITQVQMAVMMMLRMMVMAPMMMIGGIIMAVSKDPKLSLVIAVVVPILLVIIVIVAKVAIPLFKSMQVKIDKLNLVLRENLTGIRVIRAFNRIVHETRRFGDANADLTNTAIKVNKLMALMMPLMMLILNLTTIAIIWFGSIRIDSGAMQVGDLMAFIQYAMRILFSLLMATMMLVMIPRASASAIRINEVLDVDPEIKDPENPKGSGAEKGCVEFRDVEFSYHGAEEPAVTGVSFAAKPGEVTAIVGGTGSGKSTLMNLIPRFYDADRGAVLVDGVDVREMSQEELRSKIGFIPQTAVLFTGTVSENIRYGRDDAADDEVLRAAEIAQAAGFVGEMSEGFDSVISQGGRNLSGGQKQRLAIARALVRRPEVYVFDDTFSALDFKTDAALRRALRDETKEATVLIVAQRVSTVMDADRIVVLEEGKVVGIGTHRELLDGNEVYREIVTSQLSEEEIA